MPVSDLWEVLRRPLITEKGTVLAESGKYLFEVHIDATKAQIKSAVEKDRKSTRLNSSHVSESRMPSSA